MHTAAREPGRISSRDLEAAASVVSKRADSAEDPRMGECGGRHDREARTV